jgi:hypothetical protein
MYGDLAGWRAYALARGDNAPTNATDEVATAALVRGSDYIRYRYVANLLPGYDETFTPAGYEAPLAELGAYIAAGYELAKPGFFSKVYTPSEQKVLTEVKGIKWTVTGQGGATYGSSPTSSLIDAMFYPYIMDRDRAGFMLRAVGC